MSVVFRSRKRLVKFVLLIFAVAALIGTIIFHIPQNVTFSPNLYLVYKGAGVCEQPYETLSISGTLSRQRFFFKPTQYTGKLFIDGVEYQTVHITYQGFFDGLEYKLEQGGMEPCELSPVDGGVLPDGSWNLLKHIKIKWHDGFSAFYGRVPFSEDESDENGMYYNIENSGDINSSAISNTYILW